MEESVLKFPEGFLWGASTSSHQVEGDCVNDWSEWEHRNAERLAGEAEKNFKAIVPDWDRIKRAAQDPENYISGAAVEHYTRFQEDFDLMQQLGLNAYRFSIEWSRVEPREGEWDEKEIEHYREVLSALRARGIEPFVTLWHWTNPLWTREFCGWKSTRMIDYFARYSEKVASALGENVRFWITVNEPQVYATLSYMSGSWPPQERSLFSYWRVKRNLILAHRKTYGIIKNFYPSAQVGIAHNLSYFEAYKNKLINRVLKYFADREMFSFLDAIQDTQDFVGVNFYFRNRIKQGFKLYFGFNSNENGIVSDMGWELYPEGMYHVVKDAARYQKPVYITENGLADSRDEKRAWYITEVLKNVHRAIQGGADIRGYLHWSLLDNFEWDKGFWPRFGLIGVDRETQERTIRKSAYTYTQIIRSNGIDA